MCDESREPLDRHTQKIMERAKEPAQAMAKCDRLWQGDCYLQSPRRHTQLRRAKNS